ncbi:MAG: TIGR02453 family protein [Pseudomonadota bacterium]
MSDTAFNGFGAKTFPFLKALKFHANREWFQENKPLYESEVKNPLGDLAEAAGAACEKAGLPFRGNRKTSPFRIYRDVRFSKDKNPYKTNASAVLSRTATKKDVGGIYMHIEPENCFLASGLWYPPSPQLKALREQIVARGDDFLKIEADLKKKGLAFGTDHMLTRLPNAFKTVEDEELQRLLKYKMFIVSRPFDKERALSPDLVKDVVKFGKDIEPLMQFVWRAVDPLRDDDQPG